MSIGDFPEKLSQAVLVGIMLVGRLGVLCPAVRCDMVLTKTTVQIQQERMQHLILARLNHFSNVMARSP